MSLSHPRPTRRRVAAGLAAGALFAPTPMQPLRADTAATLRIRELWAPRGAFSETAQALAGKRVEMRGYMAPPLKPEINFFVLTRLPMAVCPFCDAEAGWPEDIVLAFIAEELAPVPFNDLISVSGVLDLGTKTDAGTGFVSRVRLLQSQFHGV